MIKLIIILVFCFWLGYKSGYYCLELNKKNTISLNELAGLIFFTIFFPISIMVAISLFFENNGDKAIITRKGIIYENKEKSL